MSGANTINSELAARRSRPAWNDTTDTEYLKWILDPGCYLGLDRYPGRNVSPHIRTLFIDNPRRFFEGKP